MSPSARARTATVRWQGTPLPNPYLHGNFSPVFVERSDDHELSVTGALPPDLTGRLLRIGPNPAVVPVDEADYQWSDGDGMVHAVTLADGRAIGYRNRWVRTRRLSAELQTTPPRGPIEPLDGPANAQVVRHAGATLALSESGLPHALSNDLGRARVHDFDSGLASPMGSHAKVDPATGELVFFGTDIFGPPFLRFHTVDRQGEVVRSTVVTTGRPTLSHDFGLTPTRVVVLDLPVTVDVQSTPLGRRLSRRWAPEEGARVGVMARGDASGSVRWVGIEPAFVSHVLNSYDDGDAVVMDVVRYDRAFDGEPGRAVASCLPTLARWTIDPAVGRVTERRLDDVPVEFPRIDDTVTGQAHRYGYCTRLGAEAGDPTPLGLLKYDLMRDESTRFDPGPHRFADEPVFVRAADGRAEDEGWILSLVYDAARDASDLVVLDATSFAGPPVATVHLPARVPFGFHGSWVSTDS